MYWSIETKFNRFFSNRMKWVYGFPRSIRPLRTCNHHQVQPSPKHCQLRDQGLLEEEVQKRRKDSLPWKRSRKNEFLLKKMTESEEWLTGSEEWLTGSEEERSHEWMNEWMNPSLQQLTKSNKTFFPFKQFTTYTPF